MAHWTRADWNEYAERVAALFEIDSDDVIVLTNRKYEDGFVDWHLVYWDEDAVRGIQLDPLTVQELGLNDL